MHRRLVACLFATALSAAWGVASADAQSDQPGEAPAANAPAVTPPVPTREPDGAADAAEPLAAQSAKPADPGSETPAPGDTSLARLDAAEAELAEYDPWLPVNEKTFTFNHGLDTYVIKPAAKAYDKVVPNIVQRAVKNIFENVGSIRRIVNTALQGRFNDSGQELGRFVINTVFGLGGFIDAAPSFGVKDKVEADTGQTFGVWGAGPGPYLVLPFLPPLTLRDAFGFVFDAALDPLTWVAPFEALVGVTGEKTLNERSLNLEVYENVEEGVLDLYSAVRNAYLQRRHRSVEEALVVSPFGRRERLFLSGHE